MSGVAESETEQQERADLLARMTAACRGDAGGAELFAEATLEELRGFVAEVEAVAEKVRGRTHIEAMWDLDSEQPAIRRVA